MNFCSPSQYECIFIYHKYCATERLLMLQKICVCARTLLFFPLGFIKGGCLLGGLTDSSFLRIGCAARYWMNLVYQKYLNSNLLFGEGKKKSNLTEICLKKYVIHQKYLKYLGNPQTRLINFFQFKIYW